MLKPLPRGGPGSGPVTRTLLFLPLLAVLAGCQAWTGPDALTRAEYEASQERLAAQWSQRLDELDQAHERRLRQRLDALGESREQQFRQQARRLAILERRLMESMERLADAVADDGADDEEEAESTGIIDAAGEMAFPDTLLPAEDPLTLGSEECVAFPEQGLVLRARVDSGATTSSLHATGIEPLERDGTPWVRFRLDHEGVVPVDRASLLDSAGIVDPAGDGAAREIEAEVVREVRIIQTTGDESRYVVELPIRLGPLTDMAEFTLTDRNGMTHPVLLGRRLMMDVAIVDVAHEYVHPCAIS